MMSHDDAYNQFLNERWAAEPQHLKLIILSGSGLAHAIEIEYDIIFLLIISY
jgi:hypothetical protein